MSATQTRRAPRIDPQVAQVAGGAGRQLGGPLDPAQQRGDPGHQLAHPERLGEVVVGTDAEPDQDVRLVVARGQHQHRDRPLGLDPPAHLVAVEPGQHHVQHHQVRARCSANAATAPGPSQACDDVVPLGRAAGR